jgi:hypothetical protein
MKASPCFAGGQAFDQFVEVAPGAILLGDPPLVEPLVLVFRPLLRHLVRDLAGMGQDLPVVDVQKGVELGDPVAHVHRDAAHRLALGEDQVLLDQVVQGRQLVFGQIVLGDADVLLADLGPAPVGQAHVRLVGIGAAVDDLGGGLAGDGPVHLVLHRLEEADADVQRRVVVDAGGVDVGDLLVETPLRGADVLDAAGQFVEIVEGLIRVLQALVIQRRSP